ncbi:MAG: hypothetical protein VYC34_01835, partial [Planctomycetota bacterium]|nr:hypothetical protein [Planctomycetota bacterium]
SIAGGSADPINTVEQVHVSNPETGNWQVRIVGAAVPMGPQSYALVVTGEVAEATEACPWDLDGDGIVGAADLGSLLGLWGSPYGATELSMMLGSWGACP